MAVTRNRFQRHGCIARKKIGNVRPIAVARGARRELCDGAPGIFHGVIVDARERQILRAPDEERRGALSYSIVIGRLRGAC